jgi:hypothetical protein
MVEVIFQYTYTDVNAELVRVCENLQQAESHTDLEVEVTPSRRGEMATMIVSLRDGLASVYAHKYASTGTPHLPHLRLDVGDRRFAHLDEEPEPTVVKDTIDLVAEIYLATEERPAFVYGMAKKMPGVVKELGSYPIPASQVGEDVSEIQFVSWLSIFPPSLVDMYGRERLLSAPAWHVEELDDGSILLVGWKDPTEVGGGDLREYFGLSTEE